jgi:hypothetical protein
VDTGSHKTALLELTAMIALLLSYIWGWHGAFHGHSQLLVVLYFGIGFVSHLRSGESARQLGLRLDNFGAALRNALPFVAIAVCLPLAIGAAAGSWHFPSWKDTIEGLPWMVAWGTVQQYGLLCFMYQRLLEILDDPRAATAGAAALFAAFHVPNPLLLAVTLAAGVACCTLYRREPNVFVLGIAHAAVSSVLFNALPDSVTHGMRVGPGYGALG